MFDHIAANEVLLRLKESFAHADAQAHVKQYQVTGVDFADESNSVLVIDQTPVTPSIGAVQHRIERLPTDKVPWDRWTLKTVFAQNGDMIGTSRTYGNGQIGDLQKALNARIFSVYSANEVSTLAARLGR